MRPSGTGERMRHSTLVRSAPRYEMQRARGAGDGPHAAGSEAPITPSSRLGGDSAVGHMRQRTQRFVLVLAHGLHGCITELGGLIAEALARLATTGGGEQNGRTRAH